MIFHIVDSFGRSYYEGRYFRSREDALYAIRDIAEHERPYGIWIISDNDGDTGEEIYTATRVIE